MGTCTTLSLLVNLSLLSMVAEQDQRYASLLAASIELQREAVDDWFAGRDFQGLVERDTPRRSTADLRRRSGLGSLSRALIADRPQFGRSPFAATKPGLQGLGGVGAGGGGGGGGFRGGDGILPPRDEQAGAVKDEEVDLATKMIGQPEPTSIVVWLAVVLAGAEVAHGRHRG